MVNRSRFRFVNWAFQTLRTEDGHPPKYALVCANPACVASSEGHYSLEEPQDWAMKHAARLDALGERHTLFRVVTETMAVVRPASPDL